VRDQVAYLSICIPITYTAKLPTSFHTNNAPMTWPVDVTRNKKGTSWEWAKEIPNERLSAHSTQLSLTDSDSCISFLPSSSFPILFPLPTKLWVEPFQFHSSCPADESAPQADLVCSRPATEQIPAILSTPLQISYFALARESVRYVLSSSRLSSGSSFV
jgi:hypothetical protein